MPYRLAWPGDRGRRFGEGEDEMKENRMQCGAKTRAGHPCRTPGMKNGRCRMHGGTATGRPIIHGRYTRKAIEHRKTLAALLREVNALVREINGGQ